MPEKKKPNQIFNQKEFMKGIAEVESGSGKYMINPSSSATGLYQQLYSSIDPSFLKKYNVTSRAQFAGDTTIQNNYMRKNISGNMSKTPRKTNLYRDSVDLEKEYKPQLGDKFTFSPMDLAALSHFLGRQGARNYLGGIRDNVPYNPPGVNKTPDEYLTEFNTALQQKEKGGLIMAKKNKEKINPHPTGSSYSGTLDVPSDTIFNQFNMTDQELAMMESGRLNSGNYHMGFPESPRHIWGTLYNYKLTEKFLEDNPKYSKKDWKQFQKDNEMRLNYSLPVTLSDTPENALKKFKKNKSIINRTVPEMEILGQKRVSKNLNRNGVDAITYVDGGSIEADLNQTTLDKRAAYNAGTPLSQVYSMPKGATGSEAQSIGYSMKDQMNKTRWANFHGSMQNFPDYQQVPSFQYTPAVEKAMKEKGIDRDYIESWQPDNYSAGGIISSTASGALAGASVAPPWGAIAGAAVGLATGLIGHSQEQDQLAEEKSAEMSAHRAVRSQQLLSEADNNVMMEYGGFMNNKNAGAAKPGKGGFINYKNGQTHKGPDKGIPVDEQGNPSAGSGKPPIALAEKDEVTWVQPGGESYVFSAKLGFAKKAKKVMNRYKIRLGKDFDGNDSLAKAGMTQELNALKAQNDEARAKMEPQLQPQDLPMAFTGEDLSNLTDNAYENHSFYKTSQHVQVPAPLAPSTPINNFNDLSNNAYKNHSFYNQSSVGITGRAPTTKEVTSTYNPYNQNNNNVVGNPVTAQGTPTPQDTQITGTTTPSYLTTPRMPTNLGTNAGLNFNTGGGYGDLLLNQSQPSSLEGTSGQLDINMQKSSGYESYNPAAQSQTMSAISGAAGAAANLAMAFGREEPRKVRAPLLSPESISLEEQRMANRARAEQVKASTREMARKTGASKAEDIAASGVVGATVERNLGEQNAALMIQERQLNLQARQAAGARNQQAVLQTNQFNAYRQDAFNKETNQYLSGAVSNVGGAASEISRAGQSADYLTMLGAREGYQIMIDPQTGEKVLVPIP